MAHPLENIMQTTMAELKKLVDVNTVVGEPVRLSEDALVIPVSRVTLGFVSGGGEYGTKNPVLKAGNALETGGAGYPFGGVMSAGLGITPVAFLSVRPEGVSVLPVEEDELVGRIAGLLPELTSRITAMIKSLKEDGRLK